MKSDVWLWKVKLKMFIKCIVSNNYLGFAILKSWLRLIKWNAANLDIRTSEVNETGSSSYLDLFTAQINQLRIPPLLTGFFFIAQRRDGWMLRAEIWKWPALGWSRRGPGRQLWIYWSISASSWIGVLSDGSASRSFYVTRWTDPNVYAPFSRSIYCSRGEKDWSPIICAAEAELFDYTVILFSFRRYSSFY